MERAPGISIDEFNNLLKRKNIKPLGTASKVDLWKLGGDG